VVGSADLFRLPGPGRRPGCCRAARDPLAGHGGHGPERGIEHPVAPVDLERTLVKGGPP